MLCAVESAMRPPLRQNQHELTDDDAKRKNRVRKSRSVVSASYKHPRLQQPSKQAQCHQSVNTFHYIRNRFIDLGF